MRTEEEIKTRLAWVESRSQLSYPPANTEVNAPLALIQLELETMRDTLRWVLAPTGEKSGGRRG